MQASLWELERGGEEFAAFGGWADVVVASRWRLQGRVGPEHSIVLRMQQRAHD